MTELPKVRGGFRVLYIDPPWRYSNKKTRSAAEDNYPTMSLSELKQMPIEAMASKNCALFMWATCPMLVPALELGAAWGFKYKTVAFWWAKRNRVANSAFYGIGNYTRANGEPVLLFTRGAPKVRCKGVNQFVWSKIRRHSEKPTEIRDLIVRLMGDVPRCEVFSRHEVPGWKRFGNELL